ncbi:sensor histidine kinase [Vibrio profundi]|uniref:sensor histidine kinase n=1 Tax=Vibrio profundi TaxID=1774960 RepID=UPI003734FF6F
MFSRLYIGIALSILSIVMFAFCLGESYLYKSNVEAFLRDGHLFLDNYQASQLDDNGLFVDLQESGTVRTYTAQVALVSGWDQEAPCNLCKQVLVIDGLPIYADDKYYTTVMLIPDSTDYLVFSKDKNYFAYSTPWFKATSFLFLLSFICGVIPIFIFAIYLPTRHLQLQMAEFQKTQAQFSEGHFSKRAKTALPYPIGDVAKNFNKMADEIEARLIQSQVFAQAIPHEVRTPLSRIQLVCDLIRVKSPEFDTQLLDDIDLYVEDINTLTEDIIQLSRLTSQESSYYEARKVELDMTNFLNSRISALQADGIALESEVADCFSLYCDPTMARLVIDNLIKNAVEYASKRVLVSLKSNTTQLLFTVEDDGTGIPEEKREEVFVPFSRLDKSRNSKTGGFGLGLAITLAAAKRSGWELEVSESRYGGAQFTLLIPLNGSQCIQPKPIER